VHNLKNRIQLLEKALKIERSRSNTDHLTKLPNKRAYDRKLEELESEFARYGKDYSLVLLDIDKFKLINDTYGHMQEILSFHLSQRFFFATKEKVIWLQD